MADFLSDTFTGSAARLSAHTGETGATWTAHPQSGGDGHYVNGSGVCYYDGSGGAASNYLSSGTPASADYQVTVVFDWHTSIGTYNGVTARYHSTQKTGYGIFVKDDDKTILVYRYNNGSGTLLHTSDAYTWTAGSSHTLVATFEGDTITVSVDGFALAPIVDASPVTDAGRVGLLALIGPAASATTGVTFKSVAAGPIQADETAPTLSSATVATDGASITASLNESGCGPANGTGGFTLGGTSATVALWTIGGATLTLTLSGVVLAGETVTLSYDRATTTDDIADAATNYLANFSAAAVTNNSTIVPIASAMIGGSGTTLTLSFGSGYGAPIARTTPGPAPTYKINGGSPISVGLAILSTIEIEYSDVSHVVYKLPTAVAEGDTVMVSVAAGAITTRDGPCAAVVDMAATNYAGEHSPLPSTPSVGRTMRLGDMDWPGDYFAYATKYANWAKVGSANWFDEAGSNSGLSCGGFDAEGMPVVTGDYFKKILAYSYIEAFLPGDYQIAPEGRWVLVWDGTGDVLLLFSNAPGVDDPAQRVITGAANNVRVYPNVVNAVGKISPQISVQIQGDVSNIRVFDKYVTDWANPPKFHPLTLAKLNGTKAYRTKDLLYMDNCPTVEFADHTPTSTLSVVDQRQTGRVAITRIEPYSNGPYVRGTENGIKVTCAAPHGLSVGQVVALQIPDGTANLFDHLVTYGDATTETLSFVSVMVYPTDATHFVFGWYNTSPIVAEDLPEGSKFWPKWGGVPFADAIDLTNEISGCAAWINIPHAASDAYVTAAGTYAAQHLAAGRFCWIELSNEPWNWAPHYPQYHHFRRMGYEFSLARAAAGDTSWNDSSDHVMKWYALRSGQVRDIFRAAWVAAGRSASDFGMLLNVQWAQPNSSAAVAAYCDSMDIAGRRPIDSGFTERIPFEGVAFAPYQTSLPNRETLTAEQYDALTVPQVMDIGDAFMLNIRATSYGTNAQAHAANIAAMISGGRTGVKFLCYEGGFTTMGLGGSAEQQFLRTVAASLHPRALNQMLAHLELFDESGCHTYIKDAFSGTYVAESGFSHCYATYTGFEQTWGVGDGSDGKFNNLSVIMNGSGMAIAPSLANVVSPVGLAMRDWHGFVAEPPATVYTFGGATIGLVGHDYTFSVAPNGNYTGTVTPASNGGGDFSPTSLTWSGTGEAKEFTYTPTSLEGSPHVLTVTASPVLGSDPDGIQFRVVTSLKKPGLHGRIRFRRMARRRRR